MIVVMLIAGIGAILAGLVAIIYGIPVQEFSFGNTLIFAGVIGLCTGMIVLCISAVVAELKVIARRLADPRTRVSARRCCHRRPRPIAVLFSPATARWRKIPATRPRR